MHSILKTKKTFFLLIFFILIIPGCAKKIIYYTPEADATSKSGSLVDLKNSALVKKKLLAQYSIWKGTKYRNGGLSKKGIDCSGFVYLTFRSILGIQLPRTTESLANTGIQIPKKNLRPGDLIFFKTGLFSQHVGIFLEGSQFLHASASKGVTISNLHNNYWKSNYLYAKRLRI